MEQWIMAHDGKLHNLRFARSIVVRRDQSGMHDHLLVVEWDRPQPDDTEAWDILAEGTKDRCEAARYQVLSSIAGFGPPIMSARPL